jgi:hypothetical protein
MNRPPLARSRIYDLYWYFASERQHIFQKRFAGRPAPWTSDPILQEYKFCNVFRAADRVSQYMIRKVCYDKEQCSDEDRLFQIVAFRTFSKPETWENVRAFLGRQPTLVDLASGQFTQGIEYAIKRQDTIYTGAFILCANNAYGQSKKYLNHIELFRHMFIADGLGAKLLATHSLQEVFELLRSYPLMGNFMAYQTAIDLNYSTLINFDEDDFTVPGPGALRGMQKVFETLGDYSPAETVQWMVNHQDEEFERLRLAPATLFSRKLHAIDCQGLFCETDKYCRQAVPSLTSARKRIKSRFSETPQSIAYFFPLKWGINDKYRTGIQVCCIEQFEAHIGKFSGKWDAFTEQHRLNGQVQFIYKPCFQKHGVNRCAATDC